uniref:Ciliary microtubule inner protein 2C n=1 Tax=Panthera tigris altaica TaxID=74533 RepID=A0A8C9KJ10_PANTA
LPWQDFVPRPCSRRGLLLWLPLRHRHPQVFPGPPQRSPGEEPYCLQQRRPLPHPLLLRPQPPLPHPGPLAAHPQLHPLQPGQWPLRPAHRLLPDGAAASEVLSRQDGHGAPGALLRAACEGVGTIPPPHRPSSSEPREEAAPFKSISRELEDLPEVPLGEEGHPPRAAEERLLL